MSASVALSDLQRPACAHAQAGLRHLQAGGRSRQRQRQQTLIQQIQTFLKQLVAACRVAQLRQQSRQLGTGFRVALDFQAAFKIVPRLAPQTVLQTQTTQGEQ